MTQPNETEPRLTRGEYWILSAVVEAWMPLGRLTHSEIELAFNRPGHGLSDKAVATTVEGLCNAQLIRTKTRDGDVSLDPAQLRECVQERVDSAKKTGYRTYYGLTEKGAAAWETFARPEWSLFVRDYIEGGGEEGDQSLVTATCVSEGVLKEFCAAYSAWVGIEPDSLEFSRVGSWEATYWKSLPSGHRARFVELDLTQAACSGARSDIAGDAVEWLRHRWCNHWL